MWFITHVTKDEIFCFLPEKQKFTVGRLEADVELKGDVCVSRVHAAFHLVKKQDQIDLEVEDLGSKYGTFHSKGLENNTKLEKGQKISLKTNELIRFGLLQNVWRVHYMAIKTATSSLSREESQELQTYISHLGGKIFSEWSPNCTHLTMKDCSITMKLLHALIDQKVIVTPAYWKDLLNAVNAKLRFPKAELYRPAFRDDEVNFGCNPKRRLLFKDCTFVFLHRKHFDMYSPIVMSAGGACKDLNSGIQKSFLIKDKVIVVQYTPSTQTQSSQTINTISDFLESNSKRIIPEYEIGLAILHCSIEKYCNPCFKMTQTMPMTAATENDSIDLTDEQTTQSLNTESIDLEIPETNENLVTSTPYIEPAKPNANRKDEESMPNMHVTETPVENPRKRKINKVMSVDMDESDGDLFQFQTKKQYNKKNDENETSKASSQTTVQGNIPDETKSKTTKNNVYPNFLEKTHTKNKNTTLQAQDEPSTSKEARKRPLVQVLDENDEANDDDLFSFGDTQKKRKRPDGEEQNGNEDDLFSFKEKEPAKTKRIRTIDVDEDSNDMEPTQQFIIVEKVSKKPSIQMPKPKILPRKISAIDWISSSFGKINIKKENIGLMEDENIIKTEADIKVELNSDINITEDHRKWLDSLKDAIEIQQVSLNNTIKYGDKSHYKFKTRLTNSTDNVNDTSSNFKKFVKKYHVPLQQNGTAIKLHLR